MMRALIAGLPTILALQKITSQQRQMLTPQQRWMYDVSQSLHGFDWRWMALFAAAATIIFCIILFSALLLRKTNVPRLGFFFCTGTMLLARVLKPEEMFFNVAAGFGAALALYFLVQVHTGGKLTNRKEPIYYLLNFFALVISVFPLNFFLSTVSALALFASLFFITTRNPYSSRRHATGHDADQTILESLERRAQRKL